MCKEDVVKRICTGCSRDDSLCYKPEGDCKCDKAENVLDTVDDYKCEEHGGDENLADD